MDSHYWSIIKWGVSILSGFIGIAFRWVRWQNQKVELKAKDPKIDWLSFVFFEPSVFALILYVAITVSEIKFVNFGDYLNSKAEVTQLQKNLNQTYSVIGGNKILTSIVDAKIKKLNTFTEFATNNEKVMIIEKNSNEFLESAYKIFQNADEESKIFATSYVKPDDWWNGLAAKDYLQVNYDFILNKRGAITRIHLFQDQNEYDFFNKLMKVEKQHGIKVYYSFVKDLPTEYNLKQDIIIVGNQLTGKLDLDENRTAIKVFYYASNDKIAEHKAIIDKLIEVSKQF